MVSTKFMKEGHSLYSTLTNVSGGPSSI